MDLEIKAKEMMKISATDSMGAVLIKTAFRAMWSSSLPVARVERIAAALHNYDTVDLQEDLTKMAKAKILRSRVIRGVRHYEINL